MNKTQLARTLSDRRGITQADASAILDALFAPSDGIIVEALERGEAVAIRGFGTFEVAQRAPRLSRHPVSGVPLQIPAAKRPAFRAAAALKEKVNT